MVEEDTPATEETGELSEAEVTASQSPVAENRKALPSPPPGGRGRASPISPGRTVVRPVNPLLRAQTSSGVTSSGGRGSPLKRGKSLNGESSAEEGASASESGAASENEEEGTSPRTSPRSSVVVNLGSSSPAVITRAKSTVGVITTTASNSAAVSADDSRGGYDIQKQVPIPSGFKNRFVHEDSESNVIFSDKDSADGPVVKGGTLVKLVERLTLPDHGDPTFVKTFLLTYRSFTSAHELLELLINRFICPVEDESNLDLRRSIQKPVRLRVFAVLKVWVTGYSYDFEDDADLVARFEAFCNNEMSVVMASGSRQLTTLLEKALSREEHSKKSTPISAKEIPKPHLPTCRPSELGMLTIHPQELARQLTLIEANLFRAIKPWELLNLAWSRKDKEQKAPNVLAMIARSNVITPWICHQIVMHRSLKVRTEVLTRCIVTMGYLEELHNFNGIMEFIAALQSAGIHRLKETWAKLDKKHVRTWEMIMARMSRDNNFKIFRESLRTVSPPSIPYLGLFLTDLTFIEDGLPDFLDDEKTIVNMVKRGQCSQIIKDIQLYQQTPYLLQPVPNVGEFLQQLSPPTNEQVYDMSLVIKARSEGAKEVDDVSADAQLAVQKAATKPKVEVTDNWGDIDYPKGYSFSEADSDDNIVVDDEDYKLVLYATIPKLVERLTFEKYSDQGFVSAFLLTFPLIMPSSQLLDLLIERYNVPLPKKADQDTKTKYDGKVVRPVRLRVFNALKQWVDKYRSDFSNDSELSGKLEEFAEDTMKATGMQKPGERLIEGLKKGTTDADDRKTTQRKQTKAPPPVVYPQSKSSFRDATFLDIPPVEIARQITLQEFALYQAIQDREVLFWSVENVSGREVDKPTECPNVHALLEHNSWLRSLTVSLIASQSPKTVAKMLEHLVLLAEQFKAVNNFNGFRAVTEGLLHPSVSSLEGVWVSISQTSARTFDGLKDLLDEIKTYYKNQQWMQKVSAPALPSLPSYLDELSRLEAALPDRIEESSLLHHMAKRSQQAKIVTDFLVFQGTEFVFEQVLDVSSAVANVPILSEADIEKSIGTLNDSDENGSSSSSSSDGGNRAKALTRAKLSASGPVPARNPVSPRVSGGVSITTAGGASTTVMGTRAGATRRATGSSSIKTEIPDGTTSSALTQEWVQSYVQNAIQEAVAPLLAEIEALKQRLANIEQ